MKDRGEKKDEKKRCCLSQHQLRSDIISRAVPSPYQAGYEDKHHDRDALTKPHVLSLSLLVWKGYLSIIPK